MAIQKEQALLDSGQIQRQPEAESKSVPGEVMAPATAKALAVLRITTGSIFLWAFVDKTFGLGYATASDSARINEGSPTKGF